MLDTTTGLDRLDRAFVGNLLLATFSEDIRGQIEPDGEIVELAVGERANIFCRFSDYLLAEVMQSAACNSFHSIQQRAARWLLTAQDRAGDRIELTQEALAGLLGVQRTTVNAVVGVLQDQGLISARRGRVIVVDRAGLKRQACECYSVVEKHFGAVIGPSGSGGSPDC